MKLLPNIPLHKLYVLVLVFMLLSIAKSLRMSPNHHDLFVGFKKQAVLTERRGTITYPKEGKVEEGVGMELYPTGSTLPDCSHACGACFPCKRVMVSFKCSAASESCPIVYRCMCNGKYYHVPSNCPEDGALPMDP